MSNDYRKRARHARAVAEIQHELEAVRTERAAEAAGRRFGTRRTGLTRFAAVVRRFAATDVCVCVCVCVYRAAEEAAHRIGTVLDADERHVIASAVAPRLAGSARGQVERRRHRAAVATAY